jgi:membrane associated rhomboid family serine protease
MPTPVFALLVLAGAALYFMNAEERTRLTRSVVTGVGQAVRAAGSSYSSHEPFEEFLRVRTRWVVVTPIIAAGYVVVFTLMVLDPPAIGLPETLIAWGGNIATRTAAGEWWRLVAATFVHGGVLHLAVAIGGLVPLGLILERAVGHVAFAAIYLAAAVVSSVVALWTVSPMSVTVGASGAVLGIYGLLLASLGWAIAGRLQVPIPLTTVKVLGATAVPFLLYSLATGYLVTPGALAGFGTGFFGGILVARGLAREKPPVQRAALVMVATALVAAGAAFMFERVIDFRPEIAGIVAVEERTAAAYDAAAAKFRSGRLPAKALVQLIDRTIVPELRAVRARVQALRGVPREQAPLAAAAEEYFRLREQSWRDRVDGLLKSKMDMLRKAEETELAALVAFDRIRPHIQENRHP